MTALVSANIRLDGLGTVVKPIPKEILHMNQPLTIGLKEAAELTGLSHWTLRQYIRTGRLRAVRIGRRVLVEPTELAHLVEEGRTERGK
jgi:excisionase family DNA binding protein